MKRIACIVLALLCLFGTAACSSMTPEQNTTPGASVTITPTTATTTTTAATQIPTSATTTVTSPTTPTTTAAHYENGEPYYTFGDNYTLSFQINGQTRSYSANYPKETTSESRSDRLVVMWTDEGVSVMTGIIPKDAAPSDLSDVYSNIKAQMEADFKAVYMYFEAPNLHFLTPKIVKEGTVELCKVQGSAYYYLSGAQRNRTFICYATKLSTGDIVYWCTFCTVSDWTSTIQVSENIAKTFREVS